MNVSISKGWDKMGSSNASRNGRGGTCLLYTSRFDYVLAEADGSKRLPLKAHAAWEPVIPAATANVVWVVGASGLGKRVAEVVHRPKLFCERCGCEPTDAATPERVAMVLNACLLYTSST